MSWQKITDFEARAIDFLLSQYRDKVRITAITAAFGAMAQELEDEIDDLLTMRLLDTAEGANLDLYGNIVDEPRGGLDDVDYRRFIKAKILINLSRGTPTDLINIWKLLTESPEVNYKELYPATIKFQALIDPDLSDDVLNRIGRAMRSVKPAGVKMIDIIYPVDAFELGETIDDVTVLGLDDGLLAATI